MIFQTYYKHEVAGNRLFALTSRRIIDTSLLTVCDVAEAWLSLNCIGPAPQQGEFDTCLPKHGFIADFLITENKKARNKASL